MTFWLVEAIFCGEAVESACQFTLYSIHTAATAIRREAASSAAAGKRQCRSACDGVPLTLGPSLSTRGDLKAGGDTVSSICPKASHASRRVAVSGSKSSGGALLGDRGFFQQTLHFFAVVFHDSFSTNNVRNASSPRRQWLKAVFKGQPITSAISAKLNWP